MIYDAMVIGGGIAGTTAAILLAKAGKQVVLVEKEAEDAAASDRPDWLTAPAVTLLEELDVDVAKCLGRPFAGAVFHAPDLDKEARSEAAEAPGYRVNYATLLQALRHRAAGLKVALRYGATPARIGAVEEYVTVRFDAEERSLDAAFMITAGGAVSPDDAGRSHCVAETTAPVKKREQDDFLHWALGLEGGAALGCWWFVDKGVVLRLHTPGQPDQATEQLLTLVRKVSERGLLPGRLATDDLSCHVRPAPPRFALEIDSHVDKRGLRIGDAGGFYSAASREGIYPAMWSAKLASNVLLKAFKSPHPQDELRSFSSLWRTTMAEYLRPPNTDAQFLLPLIFSNQQIADRMAAAFWRGENI